MARARNIKPSIMDNEELAELEPMTRLLFIYLWMLADREGRLEDLPKRIAAQALPYDRTADVGAMLDDLQRAGFIVRYVVEGQGCIQVLAFKAHQSPHVREADSALPGYVQSTTKVVTEHDQGEGEASPRSPDCGFLIPDSLIVDTAAPSAPAPAPQQRRKSPQTPIPENFEASERVRKWAASKGFTRLDEHLDAFKRKSVAKGYMNASWDDAFMEAVREDWAKLRGPRAVPAAERATVASSDADRTRAYLASKEMTPEERESAERARKLVMGSIKVIKAEAV
jgi:hypothetical protein